MDLFIRDLKIIVDNLLRGGKGRAGLTELLV